MSILICKHCKESYNTSWSYHNDDYCRSCCHIESLEQENAELKASLETSEANGVILASKLAHINHTISNAYKNRSTEAAYQAVCLDLMMYTNDYREYNDVQKQKKGE